MANKFVNDADCLSFLNPTKLPNSVARIYAPPDNNNNGKSEINLNERLLHEFDYEYPNGKWRCCSCYLGDDPSLQYAGYNDIEMIFCKACGKSMEEGLRTIFVKYDHVPIYIRESKVDKQYEEPLIKLLKKRFRNLVKGSVINSCLPVI